MVEANAAAIKTHYIVEHFETEFSDWTLSEYVHMILTMNKLYDTADSPNHT